jgi:hypothetical protein
VRIVIGIATCLVSIAGFVTALRAQDTCSLVVKVVDTEGIPVPARVMVEERDGRKVEKANGSLPGDLSFCDLGLFPVTVTVTRQHPACSRVIVQNVLLTWGETKTLKVMHDRESCIDKDIFSVGSTCRVLLRFVDLDRSHIRGGSLAIQAPRQETRQADPFGRILIGIPLGQELIGTGSANGYDSVEVNVPCSRPKDDFEQYVVMNETS